VPLVGQVYLSERATLIQGNCLEVMQSLADASVDAVITDPPYGIGKATWDGIFPREWFTQAKRVAKPGTVFAILTNAGDALREAVNLLGPLYRSVFAAWICNGMTRGSISFGNWIAVSVGCSSSKWRPIQDVIRVTIRASEKVAGHPSPKPLGLIEQVVCRLTRPGDIVLDPFMGSGTTGVACLQTGRNFVGIEIDPVYCAIAKERLAKAELSCVKQKET
jgi:site-specific DNA-methyltransferase (adenine-specific)